MPSDMKELPIRSSCAAVLADKLEQPALDNRSYRVIQLSNKLEALIVHDPDTDKASAALDVHVGNFSDRDDLQVSLPLPLPIVIDIRPGADSGVLRYTALSTHPVDLTGAGRGWWVSMTDG